MNEIYFIIFILASLTSICWIFIYLKGNWLIKAAIIGAVMFGSFSVYDLTLLYRGTPEVIGDTDTVTIDLLDYYVLEPDAHNKEGYIWLWGFDTTKHDLNPHFYVTKYTKQKHKDLDEATENKIKIKMGRVVITITGDGSIALIENKKMPPKQ